MPENAATAAGGHRVGGAWTALAAVLAIALAARVAAWVAFQGVTDLRGDESYYVAIARSIAAGEGHPGSVRPPLYPAFLAACFLVSGGSLAFARGVQVVLSLWTVAITFRLAGRWFGSRAALASGLVCALSPALVHFTHFLWSDSFAATLVALLMWTLDRYDRRERARDLAAAGVVLGLLTLTRETWLYVAPVVLAWALVRDRAHWRAARGPAIACTLACLAVVLPWTVRNTLHHGTLVLVSTNHWFPIAEGNLYADDAWFDPDDGRDLRRDLKAKAPSSVARITPPGGFAIELEREAYWKEVALDAIRGHQPWWLAQKLARSTASLASSRTQTLRFARNGWVRGSRGGMQLLVWLDVLGGALVLLAALAGLWLVRRTGPMQVALFAILEVVAVHVLANGDARFRVALVPLLALFAGPVLVGAIERERLRSWRLFGALVTVAAYLVANAILMSAYLPGLRYGLRHFAE